MGSVGIHYAKIVNNWTSAYFDLWDFGRKQVLDNAKRSELNAKETNVLESVIPPFTEEGRDLFSSASRKAAMSGALRRKPVKTTTDNLNLMNSAIRNELERAYGLERGSLRKRVVINDYDVKKATDGLQTGESVATTISADFELAKTGKSYEPTETYAPMIDVGGELVVARDMIEGNHKEMAADPLFWGYAFMIHGIANVINIYRGHDQEQATDKSLIMPQEAVTYQGALVDWEALTRSRQLSEALPLLSGLPFVSFSLGFLRHLEFRQIKIIPLGLITRLRDVDLRDMSKIDAVRFGVVGAAKEGGFIAPRLNFILWSDISWEKNRQSAMLVSSLMGSEVKELHDYKEEISDPLTEAFNEKDVAATLNMYDKERLMLISIARF